MRRIGLILFLIIIEVGSTWGQTHISGTSSYKLTIDGHVGSDGSDCGSGHTGGLQWIVAEKQSGYETLIRGSSDYPNDGHGLRNEDFYRECTFSKNNRVIRLKYHTTRRSGGLTCGSVKRKKIDRSVNICHYANYNFSGLNQSGNSVEKVFPVVTLNTPTGKNAYIADNDILTIELTDNIDNQYYNWEYAIGSGSFQPIASQFNNKPTLKLEGKDFLPDNALDKTIWIRVNMGYCGGEERTSNHISFLYIRSAPHITQTTYTPPICHGERNAEMHIQFDRALYDNERLYFAPRSNETGDYEIKEDTIYIDPQTKTGTIKNLSAGFYDYSLRGRYSYGANMADTTDTYTDGLRHCDTIRIVDRPKVVYAVRQDSVHCHAGSDGSILVSAQGGMGQYYTALFLENSTDTIQTHFFIGATRFENLKKGNYKVFLRDLYGCTPQGSDSIYQRISVKEPAAPVRTHNTGYQEPKAFGYSDGIIWSSISGGTGAYDVTWRDSLGNIVDNRTLVLPPLKNTVLSTVNGIKKGMYYIYVKDQNRDSATPITLENYCGCEALDSIFVDEPPKLLVSIDTLHYVTCNGDTDGQLVAHAKGGRPHLDSSLPYKYEWLRITADSTTILESYTVNDSILTTLPSAHYMITVTDKNFIEAHSPIFYLKQPEPLVVTTNVIQNLSCSGETNGELEVIVTGGTKPYSYFWETGDTTRVVSGLGKGIYSVFVRDARYNDNQKDSGWYTHYCQEEASGEIISPNGMVITSTLIHPTCNSDSDGAITLSVTGGVAPYTYLWTDGVTTLSRTGLSDGLYSITVTDANACNFSEEYELQEPEPLRVNIGNNFTLCKDQSVKIDGGIALPNINYLWTNASNNTLSSDSVYTISKAGQYKLTVTNQVGCTAFDQIKVAESDTELVTDFVVASKIPNSTKVNAVNIIRTGYDRVEWILPDEAILWEDTPDKLQFSIAQNGHYTIGLIAQKDNCQDILYKTLEVVNKGDIAWTEDEKSEPFLKYFIVYPNPNDGNFKAKVELREKTDYALYLFDVNGNLIETKRIKNSSGEETLFNQTSVSTGTYYLRFVSTQITSVFKIIINK